METALENILMNAYKEEMFSFVATHPEVFTELIELAIADKQPHSWRAAWLLWSCLEENDQRIKGYEENILQAIDSKKDGHQRELIKILFAMQLNEEQEGILYDICTNIWGQINKNPSVRITAFKVMIKTAKQYPDLFKEIKLYAEKHYLESLSPGVKHSVSRMISSFSE